MKLLFWLPSSMNSAVISADGAALTVVEQCCARRSPLKRKCSLETYTMASRYQGAIEGPFSER